MVTFWLDKKNTSNVYVFYESVTSWNHVILAEVNYVDEIMKIWNGSNVEDRHSISEFRTSAYSETGNYCQVTNREVIEHVTDILYNAQPKDSYFLLNLHIESLKYNYFMVDATKIPVEEIVSLIVTKYTSHFKSGETMQDYYCGITNDLDRRMEEHRRDDFSIVDDKVFAWNCSSAEVAAEVEKRLKDLGFDIGNTDTTGNGGTSDSTIVYLLKKGQKVN